MKKDHRKVYLDDNFNKHEFKKDNCFEVDEQIADTIIILNKKGYTTKACCSGHLHIEEFMELNIRKSDISKEELLKWLEVNNLRYICEDNNYYTFETKVLGNSCYIMFDESVCLPFYPESFNYKSSSIYHSLLFYENDTRKTDQSLEQEIELVNNILKKWANELPVLVKKKFFK